jgi:hypothetical protein
MALMMVSRKPKIDCRRSMIYNKGLEFFNTARDGYDRLGMLRHFIYILAIN